MFIPREPNIKSFEELNEYLIEFENRVAEGLRFLEADTLNLNPLAGVPDKPRNGDVLNADGINFNPGAGAGLYLFTTVYNKV